eukprot:CAMPEP_0119363102 /NCGR_PEP_ID=MMETSP1334-20130426/9979_1 /TAXON_ID=127549 /ORGANISM="Calcidiscus leptoporus, Strain RCC1130" /LENGTH=72 /DNA_ID=CAMNT_0007378439 /DNA_START=226 /DNA_END=444 /DNA_ORIENTATION=+
MARGEIDERKSELLQPALVRNRRLDEACVILLCGIPISPGRAAVNAAAHVSAGSACEALPILLQATSSSASI